MSEPREVPQTMTLRWCPACGRNGTGRFELADAHNPAWPDACPVVCVGPVRDLIYDLREGQR